MISAMRGLLTTVALVLLAPACSSESVDDDTTAATDDDDDVVTGGDTLDPCSFAPDPLGTIRVEEGYYTGYGDTDPAWHGRVVGQLWDGPSPAVYSEVLAGECRLRIMEWASCSGCGWDEFCVDDEVCEPYPEGASGGVITVTGLDEALALTPTEYNLGLYYGPDDLPPDLFDPGDPLAATLAGETFPAATLAVRGVAPMDSTLGDTWQLALPFDDDLDLTWTPGDDPAACVRLDIRAPTRGHGLTITAFLSCVGPDDGSITIPAGLLAVFPESTCPVALGSDCYYSELTRYTAQTVETPAGDLALQARSAVYFYYDHRR